MWAAWSSLTGAAPTEAAPAQPDTSVAAVLASSSSSSSTAVSSSVPQVRLLGALSQLVSERWSRTSSQTVRFVVAAAAVGGATAAVVSLSVWTYRRCNIRGRAGKGDGFAEGVDHTGHELRPLSDRDTDADGDDIAFADPAESAFNAYVHRIQRQKETPLLRAVEQMEAAASEAAAADAEKTAQLNDQVHRLAIVADELLTQWICSLDGVPVRQRENLKQRRKELVQSAAALHERIEPHLHHVAPAEQSTAS